MAGAPSEEPFGRQLDRAALSIASIASAEPVAVAALAALEHHGVMVEAEHLGAWPTALERLAAGTDVVLVLEASPRRAAGIVRAVRRGAPDAGIVVVVPAPTRAETRDLLADGADALVLDGEAAVVLSAAVRSVSLGQTSVPRALRECLDRPALSHRESQIVALVAAGCTNAQIANRLCLSESTVKTDLSSVFRRLGVRSRREAAAALFASDDELRRTLLSSVGPINL